MNDGNYRCVYDLDGHICAAENLLTTAATQYVYDAEGNRVGRGARTSFPAAGASCAAPTAANGFTLTTTWLRGASGAQDAEIDWSAGSVTGWHQSVFSGSELLATYSATGTAAPALTFHLNDWLGTRRVDLNSSGQLVQAWYSNPWGAYMTTLNSSADTTNQHFTGQEHDSETGNDYFQARYYGAGMGRFISPDPSQLAYADPTNPQSLNLYSYALNNPLKFTDPAGEYCFYGGQGDTPENDSDPTDFVWDDSPEDCHGQWIDNPSTTITVNGDTGELKTVSQYPDSNGVNATISYQNCQQTLMTYHRTQAGVSRSAAQYDVLSKAADAHNIPVQILEALAVTETNTQNITGDHGHGHGEFQFDDRAHPELVPFAYDIPKAAGIAAGLIQSNISRYSNGYSPDNALDGGIRDYNGHSANSASTRSLLSSHMESYLDLGTTGDDYVSTLTSIAANCY